MLVRLFIVQMSNIFDKGTRIYAFVRKVFTCYSCRSSSARRHKFYQLGKG